jgi:catechol 2,3-dioxygenase-like lactoylglutathione lyase family enzyme
MTIETLDHYSVRTDDVAKTQSFYEHAIGLRSGPRPNFSFPGAWMYAGDRAVVHIIGVEAKSSANIEGYFGDRSDSHAGTGSFDHIAFIASDLDATRAHFRENKIDFRERTVPGLGLQQIFVFDPNGVKIELNFRIDQAI